MNERRAADKIVDRQAGGEFALAGATILSGCH